MRTLRARQYIEPMPTVHSTGASRLRQWLSHVPLPSNCLICGQWQSQSLCDECVSRWQGSAPRCMRCAITLPRPAPDGVCALCEGQSPEFDRAIAAFDYSAPWSDVLARFKFQEGTALARPLSKLLARAIRQRPHPVDLVLPVPLSTQRLRERGYNQTWVLAQHLAAHLGHTARHDVLRRTRHTDRLMTLEAEDRRRHITGAFEVQHSAQALVYRRHVAVVDDVLTTGATLNEVARTLFACGARSVSVWMLARTPAPCRSRDQAASSSLREAVHSLSKR